MGDPKKLKKKYWTPMHPWNKENIESERVVVRDYGLHNKREIFIASSFLKKYKNIAKKLIATHTVQGEKEKAQVLQKLQALGLLSAGGELDNILGLELKDILERRLQSLVFRKGMAKSMKQARQFITHRHLMVGEKEISMPSYLVSLVEEGSISFKAKSSLADEEHPERIVAAPEEKKKSGAAEEAKQPAKVDAKKAPEPADPADLVSDVEEPEEVLEV